MQKIRPFRAYIDLPFDPLLGGSDMVALFPLVFALGRAVLLDGKKMKNRAKI